MHRFVRFHPARSCTRHDPGSWQFALLITATGPAFAQSPSVARWIVPFAAGSYTDNVARIIAPGIGERLGQTIVIENRAGANGTIGADHVAKAAPDGLTVLNTGVPATTAAELVAYAKKNPGKLAYGTPNTATLVGMETFKRGAVVDIVSVPYKSSPQAIGDLATRLYDAMRAALATPEVRDKLLSVDFDVQPLGPEEFGTYLRNEIKTWSVLVKEAGIQPE